MESRATPPVAPSNLTATAIAGAGISLNWTAASDDVGVTSYLVERCAGAGCTGFVQVASLPATGMSGPLTVSTNPRYFADAAGNTLLLGGSHHWLNLVDSGTVYPPPAFDYDAWLDFLSTNHHNFFRLWAQGLPKKNYTIQTAGPWYNSPMPWLRTGPGNATDGQPKFDLTQFNPAYFSRLRDRVLKANERGIYVSVMLFDGYHIQFDRRADDGYPLTGTNNINGVNDGGGTTSQNLSLASTNVLAAQDAYVRKVIDTVNDLPNVLYEIANEAGGYSLTWQQRMITLIKSYEATKPFQHPVGYTFQYSGGSDASLYSSNADWVSPEERFPANNGTRRVINNDTDHSYFWSFMKSEGPQLNRAFVWRNVTLGNSAMFMDPYLMPWTNPAGTVRNVPTGCGAGPSCTNVDPAWDSIRKNIGYMLDVANRLPLATMTPQPALASTTHCLARATTNGAAYLVFAPSGGTFTVNLSATTNLFKVAWLNPSTGAMTNTASVNGGSAAKSFTTPFSGDAVLLLTDAASQFGPTNVAYHDAGLAAGTEYSYRVRAVDGDGNPGPWSAAVTITNSPVPPAGLTASAAGLNRVNLTWSNATDIIGAAAYRLERCAGAGCDTFTEVATVASNRFADVGLAAGTVFRYRVRAMDAATNASGYSSLATATTWTAPPSWSGLVADYACDEGAGATTEDASGNGNTGWLGGVTWTAQGKFGGALSFNGGGFLTVSNSSSLNLTTNLTIAAWVCITATSTVPATIVMKEAPGGLAYRLGTDAANRPAVFVNTLAGGLQGATGSSPLPLNTWTHVAGTFDDVTLRLYVNGTQVASHPASGDIVTAATPLRLGGNGLAGEFVSGKIDGVRLYNRPLSSTEVQTDMNRASGAPPVILLSALPQTSDEFASNGFRLYLSADTAAAFAIEATTNFTTWQTIRLVQYTNGLLPITDADSSPPECSLYRVQAVGATPSVSLNAPAQSSGQIAADGFHLFITADAPATLVIERTTDLINWQPVGSLDYTNGPVEFTDRQWKLPPLRFYRARWP